MAIKPLVTSFNKMTFTPDIPAAALGENEYNAGQNIETDTRGIKSVAGDQYIMSTVPGNVIYMTGGFRDNGVFWYIVATSQGKWYAMNSSGITNITPSVGTFTGYSASTVITGCWNGNTLFINDMINPPMYLLSTATVLRLYDNAPDNYIWNYDVTSTGTPLYSSLTAGFLRLYNSPNVGSILVAGNLTGAIISTGTTQHLPTTVRWSQNFGVNQGPTTWTPTITNTANQLEVPVRGALVDGFSLAGNFYVCSYWDTVVFQPIQYTSTQAPIFAVSIISKGRGLLNENCVAVVDAMAYGVDARDIWAFNGTTFQPIGNQRIKNYFFNNLNASYTNQVFMVHNSEKYQIEIYYPDLNSTGQCNQMISYRYDLDIWNPPRQVTQATAADEGPVWTGSSFNYATRTIVYSNGSGNVQLVQKDKGLTYLTGNINAVFQRDNIELADAYSAKVQVHRVLPKVTGSGNLTVTIGGADSVGNTASFSSSVSMPIQTSNPWCQINQNDNRVVSINISSNDSTTYWQVTDATWQITKTEDNR